MFVKIMYVKQWVLISKLCYAVDIISLACLLSNPHYLGSVSIVSYVSDVNVLIIKITFLSIVIGWKN